MDPARVSAVHAKGHSSGTFVHEVGYFARRHCRPGRAVDRNGRVSSVPMPFKTRRPYRVRDGVASLGIVKKKYPVRGSKATLFVASGYPATE